MTAITKIKGIGEQTAKKFEKHDITDIEQLMVYPAPKIAEILGIDNDSAHELYRKARIALNDTEFFMDGIEAKKRDENKDRISTGTIALDKLFEGTKGKNGIECKATTEIYGEFGCGKTQFCHTMCVQVQLPKEQGGLEGKAIYVDSEGTFAPTRIESISKAKGLDPDEVLKNITVADAKNSTGMYQVMGKIAKLLVKDSSYKLIIVDSAIGLFRADYSGRAMLSERQKYLGEFLTLSERIADHFNVAIIWTNQVMINPGIFYGDPVTVIGGTILAHKSNYRVYFKKSGAYRIAKMVDSPKHDTIEVSFGLSVEGVVDKDKAEEIQKLKLKAKADAKKAEKDKEEENE